MADEQRPASGKFDISMVVAAARRMITDPAGFYRDMAKTGGLGEPIIFLVVMAFAAALISFVLGLVGLGRYGIGWVGLGSLLFFPIMALIGCFIGAAILFVIWKLMGSSENYETAFRCAAYASAIYPVVAIIQVIPYFGGVVSVLWGMYLMITASIEVHGIARNKAFIVFGIIGLVLVLINVGSERATRHMMANVSAMRSQLGDTSQMSPEQAGEAFSKFLKGVENATKQAGSTTTE